MERGDKVQIVDHSSSFNGMKGFIRRKLRWNQYSVQLEGVALTAQFRLEQLQMATDSPQKFVDHLYSRYDYMRIAAYADVLELIRNRDDMTMDKLYDAIIKFIHSDSRNCVANPMEVIGLLPSDDVTRITPLDKHLQREASNV